MNREQWFGFWQVMLVVVKMIRLQGVDQYNAVLEFEQAVKRLAPED